MDIFRGTDIDKYISDNIHIKKKEKDKFGEVFTDPELINKLLDLFPSNVWNNPHLKWLDPSAGAGFFFMYVLGRLTKGLKKWEPNEDKRVDHIIKNMMYMVEINPTNCKLCRNMFGHDANILCKDFLDDSTYKDMKFDCIVGNPPFQDDHGKTNKGKRILGGKSKLYERIFIKSFEMLKDKGCLSFIVPDNIFSGNGSKAYQIIMNNKVPFVSFNKNNQGYFKSIQQPVCYFLVCKESPTKTTIEYDNNKTFVTALQDRPSNPVRNWTPHTEKLIQKYVGSERNIVKYNRGKSIKSYKGNKYPIIFTASKTLRTNNPENAPGRNHPKAVIFFISPSLEFKMDYSGNYGAGPNTFWIPFTNKSEGKKLEQFLKSDDYKTLALATKTNRQFLKIPFIEHLKLDKIMKQTNKTHRNKNINNKTKKLKTKN
jgi:hypothetical protein